MEQQAIRALSFEEFKTLVEQSDLGVTPRDIERMSEEGFLTPLSLNPAARFSSLQLLSLIQYTREVRRVCHPWEPLPEPMSAHDQETLKAAAKRLALFSRGLRGEETSLPERAQIEQVLGDLDHELRRNNPYGPLLRVMEGLRTEAVGKLRGAGRVWAEFYAMARELGQLLEHVELRETEPAGHPVAASAMSHAMNHVATRTAEIGRDEINAAIQHDSTEAPSLAQAAPEPKQAVSKGVSDGAGKPQKAPTLASQKTNVFTRTPVVTAVTKNLQERLESLKPSGKSSATSDSLDASPLAESSVEPVEIALEEEEISLVEVSDEFDAQTPPPNEPGLPQAPQPPDNPPPATEDPTLEDIHRIEERIEALNQKREALMSRRDWAGLIALYESEIELFEGIQRQHVYMTMAKLEAIKLEDPDAAFKYLVAAVYSPGSLDALNDALDMMIEYDPARYGTWLSSLDYDDDSPIPKPYHLSLVLAYAEFLSAQVEPQPGGTAQLLGPMMADPEGFVDEDLIDLIERVTPREELEVLYQGYDTMLEGLAARPDLGVMLSMRAGHGALEREDERRATHFFEHAATFDPAHDSSFHMLVHLYEDAEQWSALMHVLERRSTHDPEGQDALIARIEELKRAEFDDPEHALEHYQEMLGADPQHEFALRRMMRLYAGTGRHAEGYAFLSRHLEQVQSTMWQAQIHKLMGQIATQHLLAPEEAILHYSMALKLQPGDLGLHESLIQVYQTLQMWQEVVQGIESLIEWTVDPEQQIHHRMMGVHALQEIGEMEKMRQWLGQVLAIDSTHETARILLEQI